MFTSVARSARNAGRSAATRSPMADSSSGRTVPPAADALADPSSTTEPVYRPRRSAILPGPCDSSRSARSRDRTSTGSRRWSSSRSPSAGAGRGTASANRRITHGSGWERPCRRRTGPMGSRRSPRGSVASGPTTPMAPPAWPSIERRSPATGSSPGRWSPSSAGGPSPRPRSPSPSARCRRPGARRSPEPSHGSSPATRARSRPPRSRHRPGSVTPTAGSRS